MANKHSYLHYPVTKDWCERVLGALGDKRGSRQRLCEHLHVSSGHLSDVLSGKYQTSPLVEPIHKYFGWAPPVPPDALEAAELIHGYQRMTPAQRELLDAARAVIQGSSGDPARAALAAMLKAFKPTPRDDDN